MILREAYLLLFGITFLFYLYNNLNLTSVSNSNADFGFKNSNYKQKTIKSQKIFLFILIFLILSLYSGLRTNFNDTATYIRSFGEVSSSYSGIDWNLSENPGFQILQRTIKIVFNDVQMLLLLSSIFVNACFIWFIVKYSCNTFISGFMYIASGMFLFDCGALKQSISIGFLIIAADFLLRKKYIGFAIIVAVASTIHMFAIVFFIAPFLTGKAFNKTTIGILIFSLSAGIIFNSFVAFLLGLLGNITEEYTEELLMEGSGVSIFRILVSGVAPLCLYLDRKQLNSRNDPALNLFTNLSVVTFAVNVMAQFGNPSLFGRMAFYFMPFTFITYAYIVEYSFGKNMKKLITLVLMIMYSVYYYNLFTKYINAGWSDLFHHISIWDLFK